MRSLNYDSQGEIQFRPQNQKILKFLSLNQIKNQKIQTQILINQKIKHDLQYQKQQNNLQKLSNNQRYGSIQSKHNKYNKISIKDINPISPPHSLLMNKKNDKFQDFHMSKKNQSSLFFDSNHKNLNSMNSCSSKDSINYNQKQIRYQSLPQIKNPDIEKPTYPELPQMIYSISRNLSIMHQSKTTLQSQKLFINNIESYEKINKNICDTIKRRLLISDIKYCKSMAHKIGPINSQIAFEFHSNLRRLQNYYRMMTLDIDQLELTVERMKINLKLIQSAILIQRQFRRYLREKRNKILKMVQNSCARKIQLQWKVHRMRQIRDTLLNHKKYSATQTVQKYLKGYKVAKEYNEVYIKLRLNNNLDYFEMLKSKIFADAQIKISYHVRKFLKKLKKKKAVKVAQKFNSQKENISKIKPYIEVKQKVVVQSQKNVVHAAHNLQADKQQSENKKQNHSQNKNTPQSLKKNQKKDSPLKLILNKEEENQSQNSSLGKNKRQNSSKSLSQSFQRQNLIKNIIEENEEQQQQKIMESVSEKDQESYSLDRDEEDQEDQQIENLDINDRQEESLEKTKDNQCQKSYDESQLFDIIDTQDICNQQINL